MRYSSKAWGVIRVKQGALFEQSMGRCYNNASHFTNFMPKLKQYSSKIYFGKDALQISLFQRFMPEKFGHIVKFLYLYIKLRKPLKH